MAFTGNESKKVTLADASTWTANYRATISSGDTLGHFFGKNKINDILNQEGCVGVRIYYGIDGEAKNLVMVGADANENDLEEGIILEHAVPCPTRCSTPNKLNS